MDDAQKMRKGTLGLNKDCCVIRVLGDFKNVIPQHPADENQQFVESREFEWIELQKRERKGGVRGDTPVSNPSQEK